MVGQGPFDHVVKHLGRDAHDCQAGGQAQAGVHVLNGGGHVARRRQAHGMRHAFEPALCLHRCAGGVEADHGGQKHGIERAVVQARVHAAQAVAQAVHAAQAFLERHGALHAGAHHVQARLPVCAVAGGLLNAGPAALQAIERDAVGRWVEGGRHKGFHAVRNRIHAGGGREHGGQTQGQLRVANGGLGHQVPRVETELAVVIHDDDGAARHLAAGAAGGGHGNDGSCALADAGRAAFDRGVVGERALVGGGNGNALGAVDGRATAHGDQAIAALGLVDLHRRAHGGFGGVGGGLVKHCNRLVMQVAQGVQRLLQHARGFHAGVGHDQGAGDAHAQALLVQQLHCAKLELDLGHVVDEGHGV